MSVAAGIVIIKKIKINKYGRRQENIFKGLFPLKIGFIFSFKFAFFVLLFYPHLPVARIAIEQNLNNIYFIANIFDDRMNLPRNLIFYNCSL